MTVTTSLVVGGGGFLGRAVVAALEGAGDRVLVPRVPWGDQDAAAAVLVDAVRALRAGDGPWRLVWCAGTGFVATGADAFAIEAALLARVLDPAATAPDGAAAASTPGIVFFASSAGATYAGSTGVPFDESTDPRPLAPYGSSRLAAEAQFHSWAAATGTRALVGRIANLYGPGANLAKPQGLVSQLALAHVEGRPSSIYVPFETTRDYLYIDDAAAMIVDALDAVAADPVGSARTKIFASQEGRSIAEVITAVEQAFGSSLDVIAGQDPSASFQGTDLRFRSTVLPSVDDRQLLPFADGVARTVDAIRSAASSTTHPQDERGERRG
ncbi:UDP-glucose 4-epimerase [Curtobacterium sp. 9128]|uniref:NAD-dependent epimerase/dehydratase family protein n=1 Tax=Curtobacterium sp. 9128 TaxID=1793722 RepID=UPI0007D7231A|nr:NAD-dependent epimerase/dehydratase family protein [Curtobacterium sp. 9128]SBN63966.1 UDP-glucose 4-epimerase [Curtobacterium sp. 9128]